MKTTLLSLLLLYIFAITSFGQEDYQASINASFEKYHKASLDINFEVLVEMAHPNIIKMGGGSSYYLEEITSDYNMYSAAGLTLVDLKIKPASKILVKDNLLQGMVPYIRELIKDTEPIKETNFFLVVSVDNGESWTFTDMKKYDPESIKLFIPDYNERLNVYINSISH